MARTRQRRPRVYYNSATDTWVNDGHEQPYLKPNIVSDNIKKDHDDLTHDGHASERKKTDKSEQNLDAENNKRRIKNAYDSGVQGRRKYRKYMQKHAHSKRVKKVIENGLDRKISERSFEDDLHDDTIAEKEFPKEAARDYKAEFDAKREVPVIDTNNDGVVDENDDVVMTPGMRKLSKYM